MWIVAGVLLGSMVLAALAGLHVGPHSHGAAAVLGVLAAVWMLVMIGMGLGRPLLWVLLGADVVLSGGLGFLAWKGLTAPAPADVAGRGPSGRIGVAMSDLDPFGLVRVGGEEWSAESLNGRIAAGDRVQVIDREGVRVQVWGEHDRGPALDRPDPFGAAVPAPQDLDLAPPAEGCRPPGADGASQTAGGSGAAGASEAEQAARGGPDGHVGPDGHGPDGHVEKESKS